MSRTGIAFAGLMLGVAIMQTSGPEPMPSGFAWLVMSAGWLTAFMWGDSND